MGRILTVRMGWTVGLLVAIAMPAGALAEDKVELRMRLKPDQEFRYRMLTDQQIEQSMNDQPTTIQQNVGMGWTVNVLAVDDAGNADVKVTYHWVMSEQQGPMGSFSYDSDTHDPDLPVPPLAMGVAAMLGSEFHATFTPSGEVTDIDGVDEMMERVIQSIEIPDGPMKDMMSDQIKSQFGEAQVKDMLSMATSVYPEHPVAVGESWNRVDTLNMGFAMTVDGTYTLTERKDGRVTIEIDSRITTPKDSPPLEMGPTRMTFAMTGDQKGTTHFEEATGMMIDMQMTQDFGGTLIMEVEQMPEPMFMPMKIRSKTRVAPEHVILGEADAQDD